MCEPGDTLDQLLCSCLVLRYGVVHAALSGGREFAVT